MGSLESRVAALEHARSSDRLIVWIKSFIGEGLASITEVGGGLTLRREPNETVEQFRERVKGTVQWERPSSFIVLKECNAVTLEEK